MSSRRAFSFGVAPSDVLVDLTPKIHAEVSPATLTAMKHTLPIDVEAAVRRGHFWRAKDTQTGEFFGWLIREKCASGLKNNF